MPTAQKRATVYFDADLHRALRLKAAETERSMSELVNEAVKLTLAEDAEDFAAFVESYDPTPAAELEKVDGSQRAPSMVRKQP